MSVCYNCNFVTGSRPSVMTEKAQHDVHCTFFFDIEDVSDKITVSSLRAMARSASPFPFSDSSSNTHPYPRRNPTLIGISDGMGQQAERREARDETGNGAGQQGGGGA